MSVVINVNGHDVAVDDFTRDTRGYVAYSIAFASTVMCADKDALLAMLYDNADDIIGKISHDANE